MLISTYSKQYKKDLELYAFLVFFLFNSLNTLKLSKSNSKATILAILLSKNSLLLQFC